MFRGMKKNKLRKALLLICSAMLLVSITIGATVAYLTSTTEAVKNTFTVGQVDITLDEADTNIDGEPLDKDGKVVEVANAVRVEENEYKLMPGHTYVKDPTIHLTADTTTADYQDAFVTAKVTVSHAQELLALLSYGDGSKIGIGEIVTGGVLKTDYDYTYSAENDNWTSADGSIVLTQKVVDKEIVCTVHWTQPQTPGTDLIIFENLIIPSTWTNEQIKTLEGMEINVEAYAIQADGFADYEKAWAAFDN